MIKTLRSLFLRVSILKAGLLAGLLLVVSIGYGQLSITSLGTAFTQNFDGMGNNPAATLPIGFRVSNTTVYAGAATTTVLAAGTTGTGALTGTSTGGTYNFANGITASATDRSLGFLTSGGFTSPLSVMLQMTNNTGSTITQLIISFDYEKYRSGSREFSWVFSHGSDGNMIWTSEASGDQTYVADANNNVVYNPPTSIAKTVTLNGLSIANGSSYYLLWRFTGLGGSTNGQAIGIDNFSVTANFVAIPTSNSTDYFRSRQTGNWGATSTWESSSDNVNWINATLFPTSTANAITIRNGHTVTVTSSINADQLTIAAGGVLNHAATGTFTINDGSGNDMTVNGTYVINGVMPVGGGNTIVNSGGIIRADDNGGGESDNMAFSSNTLCSFLTGSVFQWNTTDAFQTDNITYFSSGGEIPVFRITQNQGNLGANNATVINGLLELNANLPLQGSGSKTFRNGIIGTGNLTQLSGGLFYITSNNSQLGGSGSITLSSGLEIPNGAIVNMISNKLVNGTVASNNDFTVASGGRFNCSTFIISGSCDFILAAGGTLGIGSPDGITSGTAFGNVQTQTRTYSSAASYIYNGSVSQATGNFTTTPTANTLLSLSVANTGPLGNNTVTLTNNNTTVTALYLNQGFFAAGTNQNLLIQGGGFIQGNGGNNPDLPSAGNIVFLGTGQTIGIADRQPYLYSVIMGNGVNFNGTGTASATIMNRLQFNSGAFVPGNGAPYYNTGSTLVYNINGPFQRNAEWGSASDQGYPHHVTVQGNTILDLNTNAIAPAQLSIGGDLTIGNSTGWGRVYLNNNMTKPLQVRGNLIIGSGGAATSELYLSFAGLGGDLWLHGNFTRHNGSFYTDNNRAIFFMGAGNSSISTPGAATSPSQLFSFMFIQKNTVAQEVTLNCALGITNRIDFATGLLNTTAANILYVYDDAVATGGSGSSFVNGPMIKQGNDNFTFPVGKRVGSEYHYRTIGISGLSAASDFRAEFQRAGAGNLGPVTAPGPPPLQRVSRCEYWNLDRLSGAASANVTLIWVPQSDCNGVPYVTEPSTVVVAHFNGTSWNSYGGSGVGTAASGSVTWNGVNTFSPFALGSINFNENPLPFELNAFRATGKKDRITLDWEVSNNDLQEAYTIERSRDGRLFETVGTVTATAARTASYALDDLKPFNGWNYYRLRARDRQDITSSSSIIKVWWGKEAVVSVLPNPAKEKIVINLSDPSSIQQIQLVNSNGQLLQEFRAISFVNEVNVSSLQAGIYYIRLIGKNGAVTKTFVKQ